MMETPKNTNQYENKFNIFLAINQNDPRKSQFSNLKTCKILF